VGYLGVGVPLALAGWEAGALVAAYLVYSTVLLVLAFWKAPHSLAPLPWYPQAPDAMRFGATALATNLVNWAMTGIDRLVVGKLYSLTAAGLYAQMHAFAYSPALTLLGTVQQVLYSAGAAVQDDHARLRSALATMLGAAMLFAAPPFLTLALVSDTVVLALYGPRWEGAAALLTPLALAMPAVVATGLVTPLLWNSGEIGRELQVQLPVSLAWAMLCLMLALVAPLPAVAWGLAALLALRAVLLGQAAMRALRLPLGETLRALRGGATVAVGTALLGLVADTIVRRVVAAPGAWLAADILAGAIAMATGAVLARHWFTPALRFLLAQLAGRLPTRLGGYLAALFMPRPEEPERGATGRSGGV
jgi:lipopolysaccharide exporter